MVDATVIVGTKLQLLLSSPVEEYKITKLRQHLTLRDNKDEKVCRDRVYLEADMGCFVQETVLESELRLKKADIVGNVEVGRLGLGTVTSTRLGTADKEVLKMLLLKKLRVKEIRLPTKRGKIKNEDKIKH